MEEFQTRRKFIINSSKTLTFIVSIVTFGKHLSFSQTSKETGMISRNSSLENDNQNNILIAYESHFGSTAETAKFIGKNLLNITSKVEVKKIAEIDNLSQYSKVIIGSAIQYDNWMPEARKFIIKNENELASKDVSFFLVCLALAKSNDKSKLKADSYVNKIKKIAPKIKVENFGKFAGVLDYSKMSFGQRIIAKALFAIIGVKEGDYRDWEVIKEWAEKLYSF